MPGGKRDVYFSVRSFAGYGKLSRRKIDELVVGRARRAGEDKRDPLDFALWKGAAPTSGAGTARGVEAGPAGTSSARR